MTFRDAYRELEARMKALAEADDDDVYVPNPEPLGPVDYVFICMEPSLTWARSPDEGRAKVEAGFRSFVWSIEDFILHFCIRRYLCEPTEQYYITDMSKGAMPVDRARIGRTQRWGRWYDLLVEEVNLVAKPRARVFAVGGKVYDYLVRVRSDFPWPLTCVVHYAAWAHTLAERIVGHEDTFEQFKSTVSLELVLATAGACQAR